MTHKDALAAYLRRPVYEKYEVLADFAFRLTVLARDSYEVGDDGITDTKRFRAINEVQHRVTSQIITRLRDDPMYQMQEVLLGMIYDSHDADLRAQLVAAFEQAMGNTRAIPPA